MDARAALVATVADDISALCAQRMAASMDPAIVREGLMLALLNFSINAVDRGDPVPTMRGLRDAADSIEESVVDARCRRQADS